jgi:ABC-type amino acid transport substrate-binding protein
VPDLIDPVETPNPSRRLSSAALAVAIVALAIVGWQTFHATGSSGPAATTPTRWDHIRSSHLLRVGYGGYPPYTIVKPGEPDPTKRVTGFSVDLVNAIAGRTVPPLKVQWEQFSFDTMKADLDRDRFDVIADPVFETIPRAFDFTFSEPYSYFGIAVAIVRSGDERFSTFADLDRPGITIALAEGWTSSEYARKMLHKPTLKSIPVTGDAINQLDEVIFGRADVALNDVPTVLQYARAHKGRVKALWLDSPPSSVAGAFVVRTTDSDLRQFLDTSISVLRADGTIDTIDKKWKSLGFFPEPHLRPGAGLKNTAAAEAMGRP